MSWFRYIALALLLISGCAKPHSESELLQFGLGTKAAVGLETGSTYRILMYNESDRSYYGSGTYHSASGFNYLLPCELDDDGNFIKDDESKGIIGRGNKYNLVLASPGKACDENGAFKYVPDASPEFYVNAPVLKTIGGYGRVTFDKVLYQPSSKISFEFYKKPEVAEFSVVSGNVKLIGVNKENESVKIYPALRQVEMESHNHERALVLTEDPSHTENPGINNYQRYYYTGAEDILPIAAGIYAPRAEAIRYLNLNVSDKVLDGDYIYATCTLNQGGRTISIRLPLNDKEIEMKPMHHYVYQFLVESDYISVILDVYDMTNSPQDNDWQPVGDGGNISSSIGTLSTSYTIGKWTDDGWQPAGGGNIGFEIG